MRLQSWTGPCRVHGPPLSRFPSTLTEVRLNVSLTYTVGATVQLCVTWEVAPELSVTVNVAVYVPAA